MKSSECQSVEYQMRVTSPSDRIGAVGQIRHDLPDNAVEDLVESGHVKIVEASTVAKGKPQNEDENKHKRRGAQ